MYQFLLMQMDKETDLDISSLRVCLCAASPLPRELHEQIEQRFGREVIEGYGSSETACGGTLNPLHARRIGSIGKAIGCLEITIRGLDGTILPPGAENVGEIAVRGPNVMKGYYRKPEATREAFTDGTWFLSGDLGYADEDGYLYISGRKKELIIRGGLNIYPREVEEVIMRMQGVREVAVVGVPDKLMGERVKAVLALAPGALVDEEQVKEFCAQHLAQYKVPRIVEFIDALPRNATGKILKRALV
jgi:long-chain acyl-CoA synthetase